MKYLIYKLTAPNNKCYIGWTKRKFKTRLNEHIRCARKGIKQKIYEAIRKYPIELWLKEVIYESEDKIESLNKEIEYIQLFNSIKNGYNTSTGGQFGSLGIKKSKLECLKASERIKQLHRDGKFNYKQMGLSKKGFKQSELQKSIARKIKEKNWEITIPDGKNIIITNLLAFCKEHSLDQGNMVAVSKGRLKQHKKYKVRLL